MQGIGSSSAMRVAGARHAVVIAAGVALAMAGLWPSAAAAEEPRVRKEVSVLTAQEKRDFVGALLALKSTPSPHDPRLSWYDQFVQWHVELNHCTHRGLEAGGIWGHGGPMFLPWHRQYILLLEDAMRDVSGKDITLPYWDFTDPDTLDDVFSEDFMGGSGDPERSYAVTTGAFRRGNWRLNITNNDNLMWRTTTTTYITRNIGDPNAEPNLPSAADLEAALAVPTYDVAPWDFGSKFTRSFRNFLEGVKNNERPYDIGAIKACREPDQQDFQAASGRQTLHNQIHDYVAGIVGVTDEGATLVGTLGVPLASPNDPVFFLLHANVDRIWAEWQRRHPGATYLPTEGFPENSAGDVMHPFGSRPPDVESIASLGYAYAEPGESSPADVAASGTAERSPRTTRLLCRLDSAR